jgi:hypothetical protein
MNYEHFSKKIYALISVFVNITGKGSTQHSPVPFDILKLDYKNEKVIQEGYDNNRFSAEIAEGFQLGKCSPFLTPASSIKSAANTEQTFGSNNNTSNSAATIVFCEMKITAIALNDLLRAVTEYWKKKLPRETTEFPLRVDSILGTDSLDKQRKALKSLKTGSLNLLFATDVAQEGLDIPHCNLIVNFNGPKTLIGFIQRRGRARSENSLLISLVNEFRDEAEDYEFRDFKKFLKEENETSNQLKSFQDCIGLMSDEFANEENRFILPSTGAHIDIIKAKSVLQEYCDYIYRLEIENESENQVHDEIYYSPRSFFDGGKQGKLLLPETVRKRLKLESAKDFPPFVVVGGKKVEDQGKLALQAIKYLHGKGEFDDHLSFRDAIIPLQGKHSSVSKTPKKPVDERMMSLRVKKACDHIVSQPNSSNTFYFYSVELNGEMPGFHQFTTKILSQLDCLKSIVYGFCFELPDVVLASAFSCQLRLLPWNSLLFRLKFIGKRILSSDELRNIQIWMKTVNGLHSLELEDFREFKNLGDFTENHLESMHVYSFEEWKSKSDSSHFISFPFRTAAKHDRKDINSISSSYFQEIALHGLHFSYNLSVIQRNNELNRKTSFYHSSKDSLKDQIVTTDGKNMFCFESNDLLVSSTDFQASLKDLNCIMDPRQKNNSKTFLQHFSAKYSPKHDGFVDFLKTINQQEDYRLTRGYPLTGIMSFIPLFSSANLHDQDSQRIATENDFIPECCYPVGSLSFYYLSLLLPTLTFRVQSVLLASELWTKLFHNTEISKVLSLNNLLTAMTPRRQGENINSER